MSEQAFTHQEFFEEHGLCSACSKPFGFRFTICSLGIKHYLESEPFVVGKVGDGSFHERCRVTTKPKAPPGPARPNPTVPERRGGRRRGI